VDAEDSRLGAEVRRTYVTDLRFLHAGDLVLTSCLWFHEPAHSRRFVEALAGSGAEQFVPPADQLGGLLLGFGARGGLALRDDLVDQQGRPDRGATGGEELRLFRGQLGAVLDGIRALLQGDPDTGFRVGVRGDQHPERVRLVDGRPQPLAT
jgi:hypothetical protein